MPVRLFCLFLLPALLLSAAKKTVATARGENEDLVLTVTLHIDPADVKQMVGSDLGGHYIVAEVKVEPKYGKEVAIDHDDFQVRTDKDGEKAKPFEPSQIAGRGALIVSQTAGSRTGGGVGMGSPGGYPPGGYPPGGYPGGYPPMGGPPVGYPGPGAGVGTGGAGDSGDTKATMQHPAKEKENPLEKVLADKILPQKKSEQPVSGLLYFPLEKQKMKDLELYYGGKENRISLRFK
ncbi:MAG: hypothetical protein LAP87_20185 [Acidobacteriia bacterium]|nr:hypothetical protein [Terriglobia bacterium]